MSVRDVGEGCRCRFRFECHLFVFCFVIFVVFVVIIIYRMVRSLPRIVLECLSMSQNVLHCLRGVNPKSLAPKRCSNCILSQTDLTEVIHTKEVQRLYCEDFRVVSDGFNRSHSHQRSAATVLFFFTSRAGGSQRKHSHQKVQRYNCPYDSTVARD